jgi:hypothetical protein
VPIRISLSLIFCITFLSFYSLAETGDDQSLEIYSSSEFVATLEGRNVTIAFKKNVLMNIPNFIRFYILSGQVNLRDSCSEKRSGCDLAFTDYSGRVLSSYYMHSSPYFFYNRTPPNDYGTGPIVEFPQFANLKNADYETFALNSVKKQDILKMYFYFAKRFGEVCKSAISESLSISGKVTEVTTQGYQSYVSDSLEYSYNIEKRFYPLAYEYHENFYGYTVLFFGQKRLIALMDNLVRDDNCHSKEIQNAREMLYKLGEALNDWDNYFLVDSDGEPYNLDIYNVENAPVSPDFPASFNGLLSLCDKFKKSGRPVARMLSSCKCLIGLTKPDRRTKLYSKLLERQDEVGLFGFALATSKFPEAMACLVPTKDYLSSRTTNKPIEQQSSKWLRDYFSLMLEQKSLSSSQPGLLKSEKCIDSWSKLSDGIRDIGACEIGDSWSSNIYDGALLDKLLSESVKQCGNQVKVNESILYRVAHDVCQWDKYGLLTDEEVWLSLIVQNVGASRDKDRPQFTSDRYCYEYTKKQIEDYKVQLAYGKFYYPRTLNNFGYGMNGLVMKTEANASSQCIANFVNDFIIQKKPLPYDDVRQVVTQEIARNKCGRYKRSDSLNKISVPTLPFKESGIIVLGFDVNGNGRIENVKVIRDSFEGVYNEQVLQQAKEQLKFEPEKTIYRCVSLTLRQ